MDIWVNQEAADLGDRLWEAFARRQASASDLPSEAHRVHRELCRIERSRLKRSPEAYLLLSALGLLQNYERAEVPTESELTGALGVAGGSCQVPIHWPEGVLGSLSKAELVVCVLRRREHMSIEEIATYLGMSPQDVQRTLAAALGQCARFAQRLAR